MTTQDRLRVAIVAETFLPHVNGVTNSVLRLLEHLRRRGHDALVIAPGPGADVVEGVEVRRVRSFDLPRYGDLRIGLPTARVGSLLRQYRPDVVHLAAPSVLGAAAVGSARRQGIPTVAVYQTDLAGFARQHGLGMVSGAVWRWLRHVHDQADITLAPSTSAMWELQGRGVRNVALWPRGVDLERFHPDHRSPLLHRRLAPSGAVVVGYVGRLAREKQVERLAPLAALAGVRLVIVGDGPERARLESRMPDATFVGFRSGADLAAHLASFDIFVTAGPHETFCQAVQEAMAAGVPVVAPACGGPLDLVAHGRTGFLWTPDRPETLTGAVRTLADDPARREEMARAARASIEHRPWEAVMDALLTTYRSVIAPRDRPQRAVA